MCQLPHYLQIHILSTTHSMKFNAPVAWCVDFWASNLSAGSTLHLGIQFLEWNRLFTPTIMKLQNTLNFLELCDVQPLFLLLHTVGRTMITHFFRLTKKKGPMSAIMISKNIKCPLVTVNLTLAVYYLKRDGNAILFIRCKHGFPQHVICLNNIAG